MVCRKTPASYITLSAVFTPTFIFVASFFIAPDKFVAKNPFGPQKFVAKREKRRKHAKTLQICSKEALFHLNKGMGRNTLQICSEGGIGASAGSYRHTLSAKTWLNTTTFVARLIGAPPSDTKSRGTNCRRLRTRVNAQA